MRSLAVTTIQDAVTEAQIERCFHVMSELRPGFSPESFVSQVKRQQKAGYMLTYLKPGPDANIVAVAGWRIRENLAMGLHLYVDDLVTSENCRRQGIGKKLLEHVLDRGKKEGCSVALLDSGVQRFQAHRFYLREGFDIRAYLFMCSMEADTRA